jgi:GTP-binding protein HflX
VEDRLFATLDPTTRRLALPGGEPVLLTDTVGFIRALPHGLIESFKSTLEVAAEADMLVHVVDGSAAHPEVQITAVREVLAEIGADNVPEFLVFNKADMLDDWGASLVADYEGAVVVSALKSEGLDIFMRRLSDRMRAITRVTELLVPYDRGDILASIHREGEVVLTEQEPDGMRIRARLSEASEGRLREFVVAPDDGRN